MRGSTMMIVASAAMLSWPNPQFAYGQGGAATPRAQIRYSNPMGQSLGWLFNPQISKELELVPEQKDKLTAIRTEMSTKLRETFKSIGDLDAEQRRKEYEEARHALGAETERQVEQVLLEHQLDRLRQIMLQMKLRTAGYGSASVLAEARVAEALGLSDEQKKQLLEREATIRQETREKTQAFYKTLREQSREKLLGVLTAEQRQKLDDLMGEKYDWQAASWRRRQATAPGTGQAEKRQQKD